VKLFEAGKLIEPLRAIILQNVRQPELLWGDLQSQFASLHIGAANIERLAAKLGEARFEKALTQLLDASEAGMRAVIGRIPDGTYAFEDKIDDDGITDAPIEIRAKVTVSGDEMTVDLTGCSPQSLGPSNATLASTCSTVFYTLMATADVPVPSNAGCYRPVKIIAPPGSCVNASAPAPVVHRIAIGHRLATVLFAALHQAVPERMPAAYYAVSYVVTFQTIDPEKGRKVLVEIEIGGCGGLPYSDGASAHSFGMHNNANIPMEMIESDMPLTFLGYGLLPDSGGAGRHRGGLGLWREWRIDCPTAQLSTNLDRFKFRPFGLDGGEPAATSALYLTRDGVRQALPSKVMNLMVRKGDIVRLETSGGGGFGAARMRARELVERDVRLGYVSPAAAATTYGHDGRAPA
jgi:N-methylhydantoinase B